MNPPSKNDFQKRKTANSKLLKKKKNDKNKILGK